MNIKGLAKSTAIIILLVIIIVAVVGVYYIAFKPGEEKTIPPSTTQKTETPTTSPSATKTSPTPSPTTQRKYRIAVLFDVGGRGNLSFNDMAYLGAERAKKELGVEVEYLTPKSLQDMIPLLERLSKEKTYDLLVLIGFLWTDPLNKTADKFPEQKFALIDSTTGVVRDNEVDILFREQECAALVGIIAAGIAHELGGDTIGAVAGMDIPPLWKFHIGYLFGAKYYEMKTGNKVNFLWQYTGTFTDTQVGYNTGWQLLEQGAKVLYGLAGLTHVGMFNAIVDWNKQGRGKAFGIGQDVSQEWYAPEYIILSGAKRVDVAVYTAIEMVVKGTWKGGIITLGLKEGGVGLWDLDGVRTFAELAYETGQLKDMTPDQVVDIVKQLREKYIKPEVWNLVKELEEKIKNGEIAFKTR